jgi:hypothetical protein
VGKEAEGWGFPVIGSLGKFVEITAIIYPSNDLDLEFVFSVVVFVWKYGSMIGHSAMPGRRHDMHEIDSVDAR